MHDAKNAVPLTIEAVNLGEQRTASFWRKVDRRGPDECWPWKAGKQGFGYGQFFIPGRILNAHRIAYLMINGPIPSGLFVLHRCDNAPCCNPAHLFLGTQAVNIADKCNKRRQAAGSAHGSITHPEKLKRGAENSNSKLTTENVIAIRKMRRDRRIKVKAIAQMFGITERNVFTILARETWRHIE
jgi:hypothetical protein